LDSGRGQEAICRAKICSGKNGVHLLGYGLVTLGSHQVARTGLILTQPYPRSIFGASGNIHDFRRLVIKLSGLSLKGMQYATWHTYVFVDDAGNGTRIGDRVSVVIRNLYRSQSVQRLQELQILQALCKRGGNVRSLQAVRVAAVTFLLWASVAQAQTLTTAQAKAHEGESGTVCGKVVGAKTATTSLGEPTFINLDSAYPNQVFTILVWGDDRKNVGELPHVGTRVCASGMIQDYKGVPEIVVKSKGQLGR
jgi:hypothetical protein